MFYHRGFLFEQKKFEKHKTLLYTKIRQISKKNAGYGIQFQKNKKGESYCKTSNIIKRKKLLKLQ